MTKNSYVQNVLDLEFEEKSILANILKNGKDSYIECSDLLSEESFSDFRNKIIYGACKSLFENGESISFINVVSMAKNMGLDNEKDLESVIQAQPAKFEELRSLSKKLKNRLVIKEAISLHRKSIDKLSQLSATESIEEIFALTESALFDLVSKFSSSSDSVILFKNVVRDLVEYFEENPSDVVGLPTPWPKFNQSIGGGMRTGVTLIGARSGQGKTFVGLITAIFLAQLDIPVLILDTEMEYKDILPRIISNISEIDINQIESGLFASNSFSKKSVYDAVKTIENCPIYYKSIAGKSFDEILSIIRRWVYKDVGLRSDGKSNECLIVYDYFKIMDSGDISDMAEYQAMGFQISKLTDFCKMYDLPCMSFVQLNRDGVAKEGTDVIAQSDRLLWLTNSFSIFKKKNSEEMEKDGHNNGNVKMITLKSRYGGEHGFGEYISMQFNGSKASLLEVIEKQNKSPEQSEGMTDDEQLA